MKLEGNKELFHNTWPHLVRPLLCSYDAFLLHTLEYNQDSLAFMPF